MQKCIWKDALCNNLCSWLIYELKNVWYSRNWGKLKVIPDWYKNPKMFDNTIDSCAHVLEFVTRLKKCVIKLSIFTILKDNLTQKTCDKTVDTCIRFFQCQNMKKVNRTIFDLIA